MYTTMPVYTCERCLQEFKQKGRLTNHMNRKFPCKEVKSKLQSMVDNAEIKVDNIKIEKKLISNDTEIKDTTTMATQSKHEVKYDDMNINALKELCKKNGITGHSGKKIKNKKDLVEFVKSKFENLHEITENNYSHQVESNMKKRNKKHINASSIKSKETKCYNGRVVDLFAGTGAFSYVFEKHDFDCVFANDMLESSKEIFNLNHKNQDIFQVEDLNKISVANIPTHDILCGGFPCQPFSIAGKQEGFQDERSNVFWKILDILKHHKPKIIILENVKNLTAHDKGNTYKVIMNKLKGLGYMMKCKVIDTCKITQIPQHRERIYMVGFLEKEKYDNFNFEFPETQNKLLKDMIDKTVPDKYYYTSALKVFDEVSNNVVKHINTNTLYQYRRYYVRENKSNCCPTLTANMGGGGHNVPLLKDDKGIRKLTPRECFNLQGFPNNYVLPSLSDSSLYKLAGNAVSVPVVQLIVEKLKQC